VIFGGGLWAITGAAALTVRTIGGGLIAVWAMFVIGTPVMAWLMVRSFRSAVRDFRFYE
jgi:hypothetical protein